MPIQRPAALARRLLRLPTGTAGLGADGILDVSAWPPNGSVNRGPGDQAAMLASGSAKGDTYTRNDAPYVDHTFRLDTPGSTVLAHWTDLGVPGARVTTIASADGSIDVVGYPAVDLAVNVTPLEAAWTAADNDVRSDLAAALATALVDHAGDKGPIIAMIPMVSVVGEAALTKMGTTDWWGYQFPHGSDRLLPPWYFTPPSDSSSFKVSVLLAKGVNGDGMAAMACSTASAPSNQVASGEAVTAGTAVLCSPWTAPTGSGNKNAIIEHPLNTGEVFDSGTLAVLIQVGRMPISFPSQDTYTSTDIFGFAIVIRQAAP